MAGALLRQCITVLLFLFYSYLKIHVDNDSCLPNCKRNLAICNTLRQTHCVRNSIFLHIDMVITCCGPSCGLWLCATAIEGAPKMFKKLLRHRNHSSGYIMHRPDNYSNIFLVFLTFAGPLP